MGWFQLLHLCLSLLFVYNMVDCASLIIETSAGKINGTAFKSIYGDRMNAWIGIPYAQPPLGKLRFKHPVPMEPWNDVKQTIEQPAICMHPHLHGSEYKQSMGEDCLYLNIYVSNERRNLRFSVPVVVMFDTINLKSNDPLLEASDFHYMAAYGGIMVVIIQYRISSLGFLFLDEAAPGNAGLYDQELALEWIQNNIEYFGGDPKRVTLMGHSTGAACVGLHMLSPISSRFFNQSILMSGSPTANWVVQSKTDALEKALQIARFVDCGNISYNYFEILDCLQKVHPLLLLKLDEFSYGFIESNHKVVIDDDLVPDYPLNVLNNGSFETKKTIIGTNTNDGIHFSGLSQFDYNYITNNSKDFSLSNYDLLLWIERLFPDMHELGIELTLHEFTNWDDMDNGLENLKILNRISSTSDFTCSARQFADYLMDNNGTVYMYEFSHHLKNDLFPEWAGATHADMLKYITAVPYKTNFRDFNEHFVTEFIFKNLKSFITYGEIREVQNYTWPHRTPTEPHYVSILPNVTGALGPRNRECLFWTDLLPRLEQSIEQRVCLPPPTDYPSTTLTSTPLPNATSTEQTLINNPSPIDEAEQEIDYVTDPMLLKTWPTKLFTSDADSVTEFVPSKVSYNKVTNITTTIIHGSPTTLQYFTVNITNITIH